MYPHQFFQNSSSSPPSLETGSSSKLRDAIDGVPNNSDTSLPHESPFKEKEPKEKDSSDSVDPLSSKDSSSPSVAEKHPFPHRLKKKDQAHIEKMRETFS